MKTEQSEIMTDEKDLMQQIDMIRESIRLDWANLAAKNLSLDQRKVIREDIPLRVNSGLYAMSKLCLLFH